MSIFDTMTEAQELLFLKQVSANMRAMDHPKLASPTSTDPQNKPKPEALQRLHEKINDNGRWTGGTNSDGYPKVRINQQSELASHVLLKERGVTLRPGQVVMHKDNDPLNLKPGNLAVGTQKMNLKQMRDEGRDRPRGVDQEPDVKTAATAAVRAIRGALGAGDHAGAAAIGQGLGKLGLRPRFVKNISPGGMEAAVDLMAGQAKGTAASAAAPGLFARKLYKPDSPITRGADTTALLAEKKIMTDTARSISPQARAATPAFHSFQELHQGSTTPRHISDHEYVPNLQKLDKATAAGPVAQIQRDVVKPLEARGMNMRDVPSLNAKEQVVGNASNVMVTPQGQVKVLDFLPQNQSTPVMMMGDAVATPYKQTESAFSNRPMNELRKEVFRPTWEYHQQSEVDFGPRISSNVTTGTPVLGRGAPPPATPATRPLRPGGTTPSTSVTRVTTPAPPVSGVRPVPRLAPSPASTAATRVDSLHG